MTLRMVSTAYSEGTETANYGVMSSPAWSAAKLRLQMNLVYSAAVIKPMNNDCVYFQLEFHSGNCKIKQTFFFLKTSSISNFSLLDLGPLRPSAAPSHARLSGRGPGHLTQFRNFGTATGKTSKVYCMYRVAQLKWSHLHFAGNIWMHR